MLSKLTSLMPPDRTARRRGGIAYSISDPNSLIIAEDQTSLPISLYARIRESLENDRWPARMRVSDERRDGHRADRAGAEANDGQARE